MNEQIGLNEHHCRRLLVSCQYIDQLLASIERMIAVSSTGPFPRYIQDLSEAEQLEMHRRVAQLRSQLVVFLKKHDVTIPGPVISARHSLLTSLGYIDIAVEELKPRYLGGYGPVPSTVVPELTRSAEELQAVVRSAMAAMKEAGKSEKSKPVGP